MAMGVLSLLLGMTDAAGADTMARLIPETATLLVYEPFTVRLEVESSTPPESPQLPEVADLAVTRVHRLASDPAQRKHVFQIEMIAERAGTLIIPPFPVRTQAETTLTPALRLRISKPRWATEMTLNVTVEPTRLQVEQPATVTVTWTSSASFARCKQLRFAIPLLADERCDVFPLNPPVSESETIALPVNGIRMVARTSEMAEGRQSLSFRYQLIPRKSCVLRAPPARLLCALVRATQPRAQPPSYFYNHFFKPTEEGESYEEVYLAAAVPEITVRDLAEEGRSSRFAGIVGPCELHTSVAPTRMAVGQPALFTVHLNRLAFARHLDRLPPAAFDGLRQDFYLSADPIREEVTDQSRSFTYVLRPRRAGISRIPAVVIQVFDPAADQYRTLRSAPLSIAVEAAGEQDSATFPPRVDAVRPVRLQGVRHNRPTNQAMISMHQILAFFGNLWWVFVPLAPLAWIALRPMVRRRQRCRRDPVYARATRAWHRYRRTARHDEESAWRHYLADRLGLCAEAITADTVTAALRTREVDAELIADARCRFEQQDAAQYGKRPATPPPGTYGLVRRLQKATIPLLLLSGLLFPLSTYAADRADEVFARAMQMREEKPDEAQPLFIDAALRFESAKRFLNAGNSWYFAGETGRALANYRAAERRAPFDRQLRESIEFLRANRADAFPASATPTGKLAALWRQYSTWSPRLRAGSFVMAYLVAWGVFLTTQLTGQRVHRAVWGVLLLVVMVPLISLVQTSLQDAEGVVIEDAVARLGPGYAYDPAFKEPLHQATEFIWRETRRGWVHVQLPDDSEGWLRESNCMKVD